MALVASGVGLPPDLAQTLSTIGSGASGQIAQNYGTANRQNNQNRTIAGLGGPSSYGTQQMETQEPLAQGNLEATLAGGLGNTAYNNQIQQRNFNQSMDVANQVGNALRPNSLEQIMSGIGGGANAAMQIYPFMSMFQGGGNPPPLTGGGSSYNIMQPGPLDLGYGGF
jgi:hypothetical protein